MAYVAWPFADRIEFSGISRGIPLAARSGLCPNPPILGRAGTPSAQIGGGVDQADVRERLREVADQPAAPVGSYSSESSPTSLRSASSRSKMPPRVVVAAQQGEVVGQPEGAGQERPFARRQAVDGRVGRVAVDEPVASSGARSIASTVPRTRGSLGRQEADQRDHQQAGVELLRPVRLDERARARGRSPRGRPASWISSRSARQRSTGPSRPNCSTVLMARSKATQAITFEWVKCRRGPRTSQIPSSGSRPVRLEEVQQRPPGHARRLRRAPGRTGGTGAARPSPRRRRRAGTGSQAPLPIRTGVDPS